MPDGAVRSQHKWCDWFGCGCGASGAVIDVCAGIRVGFCIAAGSNRLQLVSRGLVCADSELDKLHGVCGWKLLRLPRVIVVQPVPGWHVLVRQRLVVVLQLHRGPVLRVRRSVVVHAVCGRTDVCGCVRRNTVCGLRQWHGQRAVTGELHLLRLSCWAVRQRHCTKRVCRVSGRAV